MPEWKSTLRGAGAAVLLSFAVGAAAQSFPTKRVTLVVPYGAGGPTDIVARMLGSIMEKTWGQPFIVENRPGAGSLIGNAHVAKAEPDGYTLLMNGIGVFSSKYFTKDLGYNPADLKNVVELGNGPYIIVANPATGFKTLKDLVDFAKKNPGKMNWGPIAFSNQHLDYIALERKLGIQLTLIPYNSAADSQTAILRNELQVAMGVASPFLPLIEEGKLVALAVTGSARNPKAPNVPTAKQAGFDLDYGFDFGVFAPSKTPAPVFNKIGADIAAAVKSKEYQSRLEALNYTTLDDPRAWAAVHDAKMKNYDAIVKEMGIQPK
jgi:tripartite-type tricarboxylate transporter receptor subunit TctC